MSEIKLTLDYKSRGHVVGPRPGPAGQPPARFWFQLFLAAAGILATVAYGAGWL